MFFIRSDGNGINTHFKTFPRPMGLYADMNRLTLGTFAQVLEFKRCDNVLQKIKNGNLDTTTHMSKKILEQDPKLMKELIEKRKKELNDIKKADALYLPRASITTGMINIHDIAWGHDGLWVVNSTFSCLSTLSPDYSFIARWKPSFITELLPEDRCHLNGLAMRENKPKYLTTFNMLNKRDSWDMNTHDGTLIDIDTNEFLLKGIITPHSPRYYEGNIYLCESGTGTIWKLNPDTGIKDKVIKLQGYPRGMTFYGPLMFVGLSKVRSCHIKNPIPICMEYDTTYSGIWIINLEDNTEIGHIKFDGDVDQIYDIAVIPESTQPELLNTDNFLIRHIFDFEESIQW
jgi:uncharacterized protein (TIGR03032 family)